MQFVFLLVRVLLAIIKEFVGVDILRHVPSVDVLIVICGFGYDDGGMAFASFLNFVLLPIIYRGDSDGDS